MIEAVCCDLYVTPALLRAGCRRPPFFRARVAVAGLAVGALGESQASVARALGTSRQAVTQAVSRYAALPLECSPEYLRLLEPDATAAP